MFAKTRIKTTDYLKDWNVLRTGKETEMYLNKS